jgi:hypothetical protein
MMVDREFPRRPFDRRTGGKKPFDPRAFDVTDLDNRNRQLGVLRLTDATIAQSFSKN